ncbi:HD domain-containing protein [Polynucleobacter sp. JS-Mosq-20-D10]|uniref:HD-GYP domain-containing protein n=1 Tax=Polynucleobacter sp. JS-Mosq-20-D10 TaxID=2576922 RepID=UPI001BFE67CA|nr:HD domain-containing phosphohydrolase [Polynucleobacter sp. JS-Mosq-20-D10]QWE00357.1 HD domain-containing protein [Polynucleobacter sp. JS-Mosq-20-D10]
MTKPDDEKVDASVPTSEELIASNKEVAEKAAQSINITNELADELIVANVEVVHQKKEKGKRVAELAIANSEKAKRIAELVIGNKELLFQNEEKTKRAAELVALIIKLGLANKKAAQSEKQLLSTLNALAMARDNETGNHIIRTQNYAKNLALRLRKMGCFKNELNSRTIELIFKAVPLHDIGKVGIPDQILHKPGPLTDAEWEIMKTHPVIGMDVLRSSDNEASRVMDVMEVAIQIAGGHHEYWDGNGYPDGLKGDAIPLAARIMSVADMYDALVSVRVYKKAWTHEEATQEIIRNKGVRFDPLVVDAFIAEQESFQAIAHQHRDGS